MSESLYPYYERELVFIRQLAQEFAHQFPAAANRLLLEPGRSVDPHVERMIEAFALLAGRIHHKLDDEFPELTDALLGVLYPHYLAPIPSMSVVQFAARPGAGPAARGLPHPGPHEAQDARRDRRPALRVPHRLPGHALAGRRHRGPPGDAAVPAGLEAAAAHRRRPPPANRVRQRDPVLRPHPVAAAPLPLRRQRRHRRPVRAAVQPRPPSRVPAAGTGHVAAAGRVRSRAMRSGRSASRPTRGCCPTAGSRSPATGC